MADKINELSKNALTRYMGPAAGSLATAKSKGPYRDHYTAKKREKGIAMAHKKLQKNEDEQVMENQIKVRDIVECVYKGKLNGLSEEVYAILSGLAEDAMESMKVQLAKNLFNEGSEKKNLTELSKKTLGSYIRKASVRGQVHAFRAGRIAGHQDHGSDPHPGEREKSSEIARKRRVGIDTATRKLTKEDAVEEGQVKDRNKEAKNKAIEKLGIGAKMKSGGTKSLKQMGRKVVKS